MPRIVSIAGPSVTELLAHLRDVDVDGPRLAREVGAPRRSRAARRGSGRRRGRAPGPPGGRTREPEGRARDRRPSPRAGADRSGASPTSIGRPPPAVTSVRRRIACTRATSDARVERLRRRSRRHRARDRRSRRRRRIARSASGSACPPRRRISRQTSNPSSSGSIRSRITRSGPWRRCIATPSSPSAAAMTSNPSFSRYSRTSATMFGSSSTTRIVFIASEDTTGCRRSQRSS